VPFTKAVFVAKAEPPVEPEYHWIEEPVAFNSATVAPEQSV
jgi:hypothetical protein